MLDRLFSSFPMTMFITVTEPSLSLVIVLTWVFPSFHLPQTFQNPKYFFWLETLAMVPVQRYFPIFAWFCQSPRGHRGKKSDSHYQPSQFFLYWLSWRLLQHVDTFVSLSHSFFRLVNSLNINHFKLCSWCDPLSIILSHNHLTLLSLFQRCLNDGAWSFDLW